ncbi:hypothetical protein R6Q57_004645 [Mikania cordata]
MPTPVSSAKQCLTDAAARALDDAVSVARRRRHSQTTSLHVVSALLSAPESTLRDACARARSSAYPYRSQLRALDLFISGWLDRLQVSKTKTQANDEPPVSNSLMAAIKRSQANQRRQPETFQLYQMHQQLHGTQSSLSSIKVELKHFILSILDDPSVSRVFGDAGFRSSDIKFAILHRRPVCLQKSFTFPAILDINRSGINFPFAVDHEEEDFKRIGLVLAKKTSRNPLLVGVSAGTVLTEFTDSLKAGKVDFLPSEIGGLNVINIDKEIGEFVLGNLSRDLINLKLQEVRENIDSCRNCGVIVNFGELKLFLDGESLKFVVLELTNLVRDYDGKLWLIGSVRSYEIYMTILSKFPDFEKDWDLNLLRITSSRLNTCVSPLKPSLIGSFVPFAGFIPAQTELENSSSKIEQPLTRCDVCNQKFEQEASIIMNGGKPRPVADQQSTNLASWLQIPESDLMNPIEAVDHGGVLKAKIMGLQRKWADICHRLHHNLPPQQDPSQIRTRIPFPHHVQPEPKRTEVNNQDSNQESRFRYLSPPVDFFASTSPPKAFITTNLGPGTVYVSPDPEPSPPAHEICLRSLHGTGSAKMDETSKRVGYEKDFKQLYKALADKVGYQNDSIRAICQTITRVRNGPGSHHVWFMFSGPDLMGKQKISSALAEVVFGSPKSLISIDLNFENQMGHPSSVFNHQNVNFSDPSFRGKTVMAYIAEELTKKPQSVVLLEHIDKADFVTKDNISRAIKTGKLSDARGRETRIMDAIFVCTSSNSEEENVKKFLSYSEERILNAKALQMRISLEKTKSGSSSLLLSPKDSVFRNPELSKKRKIIEIGNFEILVPEVKKLKSCFDLNLPLEETEESDSDSVFETKDIWLEEFLHQVDERVVFDPFDFDSRAKTILKEISKWFEKSFGKNVVLEIEDGVMVQILAAAWVTDENGGCESWIENVLCRGFVELKQKQDVNDESVVKLLVVEGVQIQDDDALCVCLPSRIMVT